MTFADGRIVASPTDLANFLACRRKTALDLRVARGELAKPDWRDPQAQALAARGDRHEAAYIKRLRERGLRIEDLSYARDSRLPHDRAVALTVAAMRGGADAIVQAPLFGDGWFGYADVLVRVDRPSDLGSWSYEVEDTKLSRETRGGTIVQLCVYSELVGALQGARPERFRVVSPIGQTEFRVEDFAAYNRQVKRRLLYAIRAEEPAEPAEHEEPAEPVEHCDFCRWFPRCNAERRKADHLTFVSGLGRAQQIELASHQVTTLAELAHQPLPLAFVPKRGALETYTRLREQARLQFEQRETAKPTFECLPPQEGFGLYALPTPRAGDLFLDLEGDPFGRIAGPGTGDGNREYLFGLGRVVPRRDVPADLFWAIDPPDAGSLDQTTPIQNTPLTISYTARWAMNDAEERDAFDATMADITAALDADPEIHVYHYAPYEPSAFKRLMGRYATREADVDRLLRGRRFVDLYAIVRHAIRVGAEGYSIKNLEPYYAFARDVELHHAGDQRHIVESALETGDVSELTASVRADVETYNRDDVRSTAELRLWLESLRSRLIEEGRDIPRPVAPDDKPSEKTDDRAQKVEALRARLLPGVPAEPTARTPEQQARFILAFLLGWHRREDKAEWWEYFRLRELPEAELLDEPRAVAGLEYVGDVEVSKKSTVQRYAYPPQEIEIRSGDKLKRQDGGMFAEAVTLNRRDETIDMLVGPSKTSERPTALFAHEYFNPGVIEAALMALGERAADAITQGATPFLPPSVTRALLLRETPRLKSAPFRAPESEVVAYATSIVTELDRTCLPIQGPPGSGKTFTGARMIETLVASGRKVGVTASSHKVIRNLLDQIRAADAHVGQVGGHDVEDVPGSRIERFAKAEAAADPLARADVNVLGGTPWLWTRPEFANSVDVLFIDEAGQMSLANALAVSQAASSLVLLGDPQQLEQPKKGSHPDGVDVSALDHILGGAQTMPPERGLFLGETWRLAPAICRFTSELFYEGKLASKSGLERQRLVRREAGLFVVEVDHTGNRSASDEEAEAVVLLVEELLTTPAFWVDERGEQRQVTADDIRIMSPFNAQVARIREKLELRTLNFDLGLVGTVDKFQGQTAAVSIYSMATSHPDDAPRGMEFLYSLNRLNVATSRARCEAIIVASPRLFEPNCQTPRRMRLANALARFKEMATALLA